MQDMGMGGQVYDRDSIEKMYGKDGQNFPGKTLCQAAMSPVPGCLAQAAQPFAVQQ